MIKIFKLHQAVEKEHYFPVGYETIGSVTIHSNGDENEDLSKVKKLMTSNGSPWYSNKTAYIVHSKARSIEVNDVLEDDGKFWLYSEAGFLSIDKSL